jgi:hypothetical protein
MIYEFKGNGKVASIEVRIFKDAVVAYSKTLFRYTVGWTE